MNNMYYGIVFKTGLKGKKYYDILESVMGQLSDGIWENSNSNQRYWREQDIELDKETEEITIKSSYRLFNDIEGVKKFFANKVKQIVKIEREDGDPDLKWARNNNCTTCYISPYSTYVDGKRVEPDYEITVGDCYYVYDALLGRDTSKYQYAQG